MNYLITALIGILALVGITLPNSSVWDKPSAIFGASSFPASLDALTNPGATDSVATVSHSSQHTNANDILEAIEAKVGITASTPVSGSIFAGTGAGTSIWTTYGTTTNFNTSTFTSTGLSTLAQFISQASSTIVGGLTITGNSTTTNATSTIGAFTSFATTTQLHGAGLTTCTSSNFLQWSGGSFACGTPTIATALGTAYATSSNSDYKSVTHSATPGDIVLVWGSCTSSGGNTTLQLRARPSEHSASTTLSDKSASDVSATLFGLFTATTTTSLSLDLNSSGCDQGIQLMTLFINA